MRINEIFYSLQGEGHFAGTPVVFVRFSGCNMRCPFCDTDFDEYSEMTISDIVAAIKKYPAGRVVLTGGEPTLQMTRELIDSIHEAGFKIHVETNGTHPLPAPVDWLTCSPKGGLMPVVENIDELKVVFQGADLDYGKYLSVAAREYYLQPCDTGDAASNRRILESAIEYVKSNPQWCLSLQLHKLIGIR